MPPGPTSCGADGLFPAGRHAGTPIQHMQAHIYTASHADHYRHTEHSHKQHQQPHPAPLLADQDVPLIVPLEANLSLNIKSFNEQCMGQSPTTVSGSARSLKRCGTSQFLIYTCTNTEAPILRVRVHPPVPALLAKGGPSAIALQDGQKRKLLHFSPHQQGKFHSLTGVNVPGTPVPSQFNPFCSWTSSPSMPDHSLVADYHC